nr:hypothetical protein [Solemoviridae sp.]
MNSTLPIAFTRDAVERWGAANPRLGLVLPLLKFFGVLRDVDVVYERAPIGWIEWFWSLFGYIYQETIPEVHVDWWRVLLVGLIVVLVILSLLYVAGKVAASTLRYFVECVSRIRASVVYFFEKTADIFRVQASTLEPGASRCLVPYATVLESAMPDSPFVKLMPTDGQVTLSYVDYEQKRRVVGCAVRLRTPTHEDYLLVPLHVWSVFDRDIPFVSARGKGDWFELDTRSVSLKGAPVERAVVHIDTDVVCVRISEQEASRLAVRVPKIGPATTTSLVRISGPNGIGSTGSLRPDNVVFGQYIYTGSTEPGFSGAAYTNGHSVLAIHLGGGQRNFGYSIRLAYVTLLHFLKVKQEDTQQWIEDLVRKKRRRIVVDTSWQDADTVRFQADWDYHVVDKTVFYGTVGEEDQNVVYRDFSKPEAPYKPHCCVPEAAHSGNCCAMTCNGDGRSSIVCTQGNPQLHHHEITHVSGPSKTSQKAASKKSGAKQKTTTSGQTNAATVSEA